MEAIGLFSVLVALIYPMIFTWAWEFQAKREFISERYGRRLTLQLLPAAGQTLGQRILDRCRRLWDRFGLGDLVHGCDLRGLTAAAGGGAAVPLLLALLVVLWHVSEGVVGYGACAAACDPATSAG